jgi:hypothetical protein
MLELLLLILSIILIFGSLYYYYYIYNFDNGTTPTTNVTCIKSNSSPVPGDCMCASITENDCSKGQYCSLDSVCWDTEPDLVQCDQDNTSPLTQNCICNPSGDETDCFTGQYCATDGNCYDNSIEKCDTGVITETCSCETNICQENQKCINGTCMNICEQSDDVSLTSSCICDVDSTTLDCLQGEFCLTTGTCYECVNNTTLEEDTNYHIRIAHLGSAYALWYSGGAVRVYAYYASSADLYNFKIINIDDDTFYIHSAFIDDIIQPTNGYLTRTSKSVELSTKSSDSSIWMWYKGMLVDPDKTVAVTYSSSGEGSLVLSPFDESLCINKSYKWNFIEYTSS